MSTILPTTAPTQELYVRNVKDCYEIKANDKEYIYELLGKNNGNSPKVSVAFVRILSGGSSKAHHHPVVEESYTITKGEARLIVDGKVVQLKKGDLVQIPVGKIHQIFNDAIEDLEFVAVVAPAWTPDCGIYV